MDNALTIDLEEWYHICTAVPDPLTPPAGERRLRGNTGAILAILERFQVVATFFILGSVAEAEPSLVPLIAAAGHEIASHGWSHRLVTTLQPEEFRDELRRTGDLLEQQCGHRPIGFRAPQWSLGPATPWAFHILREEGFRYDSSLNPLPFVGERRGPRTPHRLDNGLWELPPLTTASPACNLPTGGGWGLRFFPGMLINATVRRLNRGGFPAVIYIHPREIDPAGPRLPLPLLKGFAAYGPRRSVAGRLTMLLARFRFTTMTRLVDQWDTVSSSRRTTPSHSSPR